MKIQVFEVIKQGISFSFKNKTVLDLIALYSILWTVFAVLIMYPLIGRIRLDQVADPTALPVLEPYESLTIFALFVVFALFLFTITKVVFENLNKREISVSEAIISVLKKFIPIIIASMAYFIIIIIGSMALIIPGIFLFIALSFYGHAVLLNNKGIIASFKESYNIVKGNWWRIFALHFIFIAVLVLGSLLSGFFLVEFPPISTIIDFILYFINGITTVIFTIIYFQLTEKEKKAKEDVGSVEIVQ